VIELVGPRGLFVHIATVAVFLAIFGLVRVFVESPVSSQAQQKFVAVPETTPVVEGLDPRVDPAKAGYPDTVRLIGRTLP
jgi:hypothetical protein